MEHTYESAPGVGDWAPKVPAGEYVAALGTHALHDGVPFQAYMLNEVPGHEGILIHPGNTENDSEGCILIGSTRGVLDGLPAVLQSRECFDQFMAATDGAPRLFIIVVDPQ